MQDITKRGFFTEHRYWIIAAAMVLFLPPLSFVFQLTQESSFCGTWCPRMFFVWKQGSTLSQFFMGFVRSYMGVLLVVGIVVSTFFFGRYWCSHLCPVGGAMEVGSRLVPRQVQINYKHIPAPSIRYGYLLVYLVAPAIGVGSLCCNYCNFATIPRLFGAAFSEADMAYFLRGAGLVNLGLVAVLGVFAVGGRGYCNMLCPVGAFDALFNRLGSRFGKRISVDGSKCNACGACKKVCPLWAIDIKDKAAIDQLSCMPCRQCEKVCAQEAIRYGKVKA
ncbi:MAG: 4Fe-4S binding protein [Magnetococcales bacterium]|nr:4Fe-4S binding protein [Nitrospirota bacterium]